MAESRFTQTGVSELRATVDAFPAHVTDRLRKVARDTALRVRAGAQQRVAVDSGVTKDSIIVIPDVPNRQYIVQVGAAPKHLRRRGRTAFLPNLVIWLEYGTVNKAARPFMRPAAVAEQTQYRADLSAAAESVARDTFGG